MAVNVKLPAGIDVASAKGALVSLGQDPNFETLCRIIDSNDIEGLRLQLEENESLSHDEAQRIRYRLKVLREIRGMPVKILNALENEGKPQYEADELDPYPQEAKE